MNKIILCCVVLLLLCGCESKSTQIKNKASDLLEDYANALDNAKSKKEIKFLKEEFERKGEIIEDEFDKLQEDGNCSLEDIQNIMQDEKLNEFAKRAKRAERDAYNRCKE